MVTPVAPSAFIAARATVWVLAMTAVSVLIITRYAIRREEHYLENLFGSAYLDYKQRVRRWI